MNYEFLGLVIIYSWVHAVILLVQKVEYKDMNTYEKIVSIVAITGGILCLIGLLS